MKIELQLSYILAGMQLLECPQKTLLDACKSLMLVLPQVQYDNLGEMKQALKHIDEQYGEDQAGFSALFAATIQEEELSPEFCYLNLSNQHKM